ncbi:MAG: hypothetical protein JW940_14155 [Polyangiaceae bacterium]|nr:hypothetical protein [Polyangiaceae bacterium]
MVHFDGRKQSRTVAEGLRGPLTNLARDGEGMLWIVGPNAVFRTTAALPPV